MLSGWGKMVVWVGKGGSLGGGKVEGCVVWVGKVEGYVLLVGKGGRVCSLGEERWKGM